PGRPYAAPMPRYGPMYGPGVTFLGVPPCTLDDPATWAQSRAVIVGAPFDGGATHRPGARFGPQAIRSTDYLPHDGSRPHLARHADGPAGRVGRGPGRPVPADRAARLLARTGDAGLDGRAGLPLVRDDGDRHPRPGRLPDRGVRDRDGRLRRGVPVRGRRRG